MRKSKVLSKLRNDEVVFCFTSLYANPDIVEMMGYLGVDVAWICNEHREINPEKIHELARAGRAGDIDILLRRAYGTYADLIRPLEAGVAGLLIPHCTSGAMAQEVASQVKYWPAGRRGMDGVNGDSFFGTIPADEYIVDANNETFLMVQIEDVEAIDEIDAIAEVDGVDLIYVGPADLSHSMGIPGDFKNPEIQAVIRKVTEACKRNGKWSATSGLDLAYTRELIDAGVEFITTASDYGVIREGFKKRLVEVKELLEKQAV
jgi:4-hydroxy-2-oxoheptanedioate aldolase